MIILLTLYSRDGPMLYACAVLLQVQHYSFLERLFCVYRMRSWGAHKQVYLMFVLHLVYRYRNVCEVSCLLRYPTRCCNAELMTIQRNNLHYSSVHIMHMHSSKL